MLQQLCIVLSAAALVSCGGGGGAPPPAEQRAALSASAPGELLAYVKDKLRQRQQLREAMPRIELGGVAAPALAVAGDASAPVLRSATTVQEAGVDEADLIKSDGELIYTLDATARAGDGTPLIKLTSHRRLAGGDIEPAATLALPAQAQSYPVLHGMLLDGRRIAVLDESVTLWHGSPCDAVAGCIGVPAILPVPAIQSSEVHVQLVEAAADGSLAAGKRFGVSGRLIGSRLIGSALYLVTSHAPALAVESLPPDSTDAQREAALDRLQVADVLPTLRIDGAAPQPLLAETDCYVQAANASPGIEITSISVFDLAEPDAAPSSRCFVGGTEALYMSPASLVLATTRYAYRSEPGVALTYPPEIATDLHKFALSGLDYRGSGSVAGHLGWDAARKPYRISEHAGDLRVLAFIGESGWAGPADAASLPASPATLTILRERAGGDALDVLAQLPNERRPQPIGKAGEQVHAVRFLGERAYVVTFRRIDPLYVLDLADPADPKVAGELEVPGFSEHLFPVADGLLFGVGRQADANGVVGGVKVALFDVRDPAQPALLAERSFGAAGSSTALDSSPHGLNWLTVGDTARIALPMHVWSDAGDSQRGLQRFEVDSGALTLGDKSIIPAAPAEMGLWHERSLQIGDRIYYLSAGTLRASEW